MSRFLIWQTLAFAVGFAGSAMAEPIGLGRPATPSELAAWDIDVRPDGLGLPEGIWLSCGWRADLCGTMRFLPGILAKRRSAGAGRRPRHLERTALDQDDRVLPGHISQRSGTMCTGPCVRDAQSLSSDETYALTAYLLYLNDMVDDDFELNRRTSRTSQCRTPTVSIRTTGWRLPSGGTARPA